MVQLQLLGLGIEKESEAVSMDDAAIRSDLIDLMARVLMVVFQKEGERDDDGGFVQSQDQTGTSGS